MTTYRCNRCDKEFVFTKEWPALGIKTGRRNRRLDKLSLILACVVLLPLLSPILAWMLFDSGLRLAQQRIESHWPGNQTAAHAGLLLRLGAPLVLIIVLTALLVVQIRRLL